MKSPCFHANLEKLYFLFSFSSPLMPRGHRDALSLFLCLAPQHPFEVLDKPKLPQQIPNCGLHGQKRGKEPPKRRSPSLVSPPLGQFFALKQSRLEKSRESQALSTLKPICGLMPLMQPGHLEVLSVYSMLSCTAPP